jgi:hypothetical protein
MHRVARRDPSKAWLIIALALAFVGILLADRPAQAKQYPLSLDRCLAISDEVLNKCQAAKDSDVLRCASDYAKGRQFCTDTFGECRFACHVERESATPEHCAAVCYQDILAFPTK